MTDFGIDEMMDMQRKLQEQYKDWWEPINPETDKNRILWITAEELKQAYRAKFEKNMTRW